MKRNFTFIYVAIIATLVSCSNHDASLSNLPINIIALQDLTDSRDSAVIGWSKQTIKNSILKKMGPKECLNVLPVDYNSQTSSLEIFKVDFSRNDYSNEFAGLQADDVENKNHQDSIAAAMVQFDSAFKHAWKTRTGLHRGTDITGALKESKKYYKPGYINLIVLLSDMEQVSNKEKIDFERSLNKFDEIPHFLSIVDTVDLRYTKIIVLTGAQNNISIEKFNVIKSFWEQYFAKCHGDLVDYSSQTVTKLEEYFAMKK